MISGQNAEAWGKVLIGVLIVLILGMVLYYFKGLLDWLSGKLSGAIDIVAHPINSINSATTNLLGKASAGVDPAREPQSTSNPNYNPNDPLQYNPPLL